MRVIKHVICKRNGWVKPVTGQPNITVLTI